MCVYSKLHPYSGNYDFKIENISALVSFKNQSTNVYVLYKYDQNIYFI